MNAEGEIIQTMILNTEENWNVILTIFKKHHPSYFDQTNDIFNALNFNHLIITHVPSFTALQINQLRAKIEKQILEFEQKGDDKKNDKP